MKSVNIKIDFGLVTGIFKKHISILSWVFLGIVLLAELTVIKGAVGMVRQVKNAAPNVQTSIVRVNIPQYDAMEKLIEQNTSFEPSVTTNDSPFGMTPHNENQ